MKKFSISLFFASTVILVSAQTDSLTKTKFVFGLSAPELLHIGVGFDVTRFNQLGVSAGIGPTWGGVWPSLNAEHRLYFGPISEFTHRRKWFFRQGLSYFTSNGDLSGTLTIGVDLTSRRRIKGWTIDAGFLHLFKDRNDGYVTNFPALRFQYYSYFKKGKKE
ncbi:MAG: hypothetical protein ICV84_18260 [Flavisolibacter sp.]|nr:hypothetical protein [Flavisolibacter sp.]